AVAVVGGEAGTAGDQCPVEATAAPAGDGAAAPQAREARTWIKLHPGGADRFIPGHRHKGHQTALGELRRRGRTRPSAAGTADPAAGRRRRASTRTRAPAR